MTVNNGGGILTFAYETKTVFNISRLITAYRMRDMSDDRGNLTGDALMLTEDERAVFNLTVSNAAQFVCDELKKLTQGRGQMFIIEEDRLIFNIVNRRKYNVNALAGIDVAIFNVLYNSCIYQFYEIINQEKQAELFRAKFIEAQAMQVLQRRLEASKQRVQILEGTNENLANEVSYLTPKAQYTDEVLQSTSTYTTTQMAKELGISSAKALNKRLHEIKIMFNQSGQWFLYADYCGKDYTTTRSTPRFNENIRQWETDISTVWTEKGRLFLHQLQKDGILK